MSKGAYESQAVSFRRTFDENAAEKSFYERQAKEREEAEKRTQIKLKGARYREPTPPDATAITARHESVIKIEESVNKRQLVSPGMALGKKGKGAGFYCEACDLTFKDSNSYLDHLNSGQHLRNTGQTFKQTRATIQEVRDRLDWLRRRKAEDQKGFEERNLSQRIAERMKFESEEKIRRREKKKAKRQQGQMNENPKSDTLSRETDSAIKNEGDEGLDTNMDMMNMMGFHGFGSTRR